MQSETTIAGQVFDDLSFFCCCNFLIIITIITMQATLAFSRDGSWFQGNVISPEKDAYTVSGRYHNVEMSCMNNFVNLNKSFLLNHENYFLQAHWRWSRDLLHIVIEQLHQLSKLHLTHRIQHHDGLLLLDVKEGHDGLPLQQPLFVVEEEHYGLLLLFVKGG